jgi:protein required for attachment to host cells
MMGYVHVRMRCVGNLPGDTGYHVSHQVWVTDMQYPNGTTIVVCDGKKLRLFRNIGTELHLKLSELPPPDVHGDVEGADRHQHIGGDNADQRRLQDRGRDRSLQEESYAAAVAKWLNHQVIGGKIEQLFVVAWRAGQRAHARLTPVPGTGAEGRLRRRLPATQARAYQPRAPCRDQERGIAGLKSRGDDRKTPVFFPVPVRGASEGGPMDLPHRHQVFSAGRCPPTCRYLPTILGSQRVNRR